MSPKRRFLSALFGGRVDRHPVGSVTSVATIDQMKITGAFFPEAHRNPEKMVKLAAASYEVLGYDCIMPYFSLWLEGEALGCSVDWGDETRFPDGINREGIWKEPEEIRIPENFLEKPGPRALLEAISLLREKYGNHVAIIGKAFGPLTLSYQVGGIKNILMSIITKPQRVIGFLDTLKEVTIEFGKAQVRAGADALALPDHATGDLVSPQTYRDFLLPIHKEIIRRIGCPIIYHNCGDTLDRLDYIVDAKFDCFHFDSKVDAFKAKNVVNGKISLMGNINNPKTLLYGRIEDVKKEALYCIKAGVEILGPECAIPTSVSISNLKAIVEVARKHIPRKVV